MIGHIFGKAILVLSLCMEIAIVPPSIIVLCFIMKPYSPTPLNITIKPKIAFAIEL